MSQNPLQQYFRQPKIFMPLPSKGIYNRIGSLQGDITNMPIYGLTGMDEILLKTPDALFTGTGTVKVIQSCCSCVVDAWELPILDIDALLVAVRIATYGNMMHITNTCAHCGEDSDYDLDLSRILDHFSRFSFDSKIVLKELTLKLRPLTYKQSTAFNLESFVIQKKINNAIKLVDQEEETQRIINEGFQEMGELQNRIYAASIDSIQLPDLVVEEREFINEWVINADAATIDQIKKHVEQNNADNRVPPTTVKCSACEKENQVSIDMDQSTFFAGA